MKILSQLVCIIKVVIIKKSSKHEQLTQKAEADDREAQFKLGKLYEFGTENHPKNLTLAYRWYQRAAHQGHEEAKSRTELLQAIIRGT